MNERIDGAIEVSFAFIKQQTLKETSAISETQPSLIVEGNIAGVREIAQHIESLLKQYEEVDLLLPKILRGLSTIGISQPSIEDVYRFYIEEVARKKVEEQEYVLESPAEPGEERAGTVAESTRRISLFIDDNAIGLDGNVIPLGDNERVLLVSLLKRSGEKISGSDLTAEIFGSGEQNRARLTQTVYTLRQKLGESAKDQRFICSEGRGPAGTFYWYESGEAQGPNDESGQKGSAAGGNRLSDREISLLAKSIRGDRPDLLTSDDDRATLAQILEIYPVPDVDLTEIKKGLTQKLRSFFADREEFFDANSENEDALFLLAAISSLESEEEQKRLTGEGKNSVDGNEQRYFEHELFKLDRSLHCLVIDGESNDLSPQEYGVLNLLTSNQGRLATFEDFNREVWKFPDSIGVSDILRTIIHRLRSKIKHGRDVKVPIKSVRGVGYVFED